MTFADFPIQWTSFLSERAINTSPELREEALGSTSRVWIARRPVCGCRYECVEGGGRGWGVTCKRFSFQRWVIVGDLSVPWSGLVTQAKVIDVYNIM